MGDFVENCKEAKLHAFPTLRLYTRDGTFEVFQQRRTIENIISFLTTSVRKSHMITARHHTIFSEGCRVTGHLDVPRVPGSFHLQAEPFASGLELNPALTNLSHRVHHLSFCAPETYCGGGLGAFPLRLGVPSDILIHIAPVNGRAFTVEHFHEVPEHYLKVMSVKLKQDPVFYQMTHTGRTRRLANKSTVPKARFMYDFSPMTVIVERNKKSLLQFVPKLFAILGGVYAVFELCSGTVETTTTLVKQKLGKDT